MHALPQKHTHTLDMTPIEVLESPVHSCILLYMAISSKHHCAGVWKPTYLHVHVYQQSVFFQDRSGVFSAFSTPHVLVYTHNIHVHVVLTFLHVDRRKF